MPMTNFPQGVSSFGVPIIGAGPLFTTGSVYFVSNATPGASDGNLGTDAERPLATIQAAVRKCVANRGDHIVVGSGHAETLTTTGQITVDVAGVTIVGVGFGAARPALTFAGSTAARMLVTAPNVTIQNLLFLGGIDNLTACIIPSAADFRLLSSEFRDVTGQVTQFILTTAGASRMLIDNLMYRGDPAAGSSRAINIVGGSDIEIRNFKIDGNFSVAAIDVTTTATTRLYVHDGLITNRNSADVCILDTITASTGQIGPNVYCDIADNAANITEAITGATFRLFRPVQVVNANNEQAIDINWTTSADA